jgi:hypothetical protein
MPDQFDIFECLSDGGLLWRGMFSVLDEATRRLTELGKTSPHEFYVKDSLRRTVVARINEAGIRDT